MSVSRGNNFESGGFISLGFMSPAAGGYVGSSAPAPFSFTLSVVGDVIPLSSVRIFVGGELAFDGTFFSSPFASASYHLSPNTASVTFNIGKNTPPPPEFTVQVYAVTSQGRPANFVWSLKNAAAPLSYQTPPTDPLVSVPFHILSDGLGDGLLAGSGGQVFFSSGLSSPVTNATLDVDEVEVKTYAADGYVAPVREVNARPFVLGPPFVSPPVGAPEFPPVVSSNYLPVLNDPGFVLMSTTRPSVVGELHNTTTDVRTIILY